MRVLKQINLVDQEETGKQLYLLATEPYPLCRSNTGDGLRTTLATIQNRIPRKTVEVPTGTPLFDTIVPRNWNRLFAPVSQEVLK